MYDYVIVGAGSAGCVLAARLSENPSTRVLLLEAGPPDTADEIHVPAAMNRLFQSPFDWNYWTTAQQHAAGRSVYWPRGRTLGGSSSINAMIYIRGSRHDYNTWRDAYGCDGWGYSDLLPYFIRSEQNVRGASAFHGASGPLHVSDPAYKSPLSEAFVDAAQRSGLPANDDFNGPRQDGVGFYQVTTHAGRRWSAADAYLHPAATRPNLTIQTDALVTGVALSGGRAVGVHYLRHGSEETARAEAEVILAAGAIGSPQLLMLSGIGPADHLHSFGIAAVADSPGVGGNLADHPIVPLLWHTPRTRNLWEQVGPVNMARWQLLHSGPLTATVAAAGGFSRTAEGLPAPDIQWHTIPAPFQNYGLSDPTTRAFSVLVTLVDVASRGTLRLRSTDPRHKPLIDPGYLSDERDLAPLVAGVGMAREFATARPLARLCKAELAPGDDARSEADVADYIRRHLGTLYHPAGTCAMGGEATVAGRTPSVVDTELRVRGVAGLRVADASVMPTVPRGNTNAPVIAIAERAADLISGRAPLAALNPADAAHEDAPAA